MRKEERKAVGYIYKAATVLRRCMNGVVSSSNHKRGVQSFIAVGLMTGSSSAEFDEHSAEVEREHTLSGFLSTP